MSSKTPDPRTRYFAAVQLQNAGQFDAAIAAYRALLADVPAMWAAWYNLGLLLQQQSALSEAETAYRQAIAHNGQLAEAHNNLGNVLRARGNLGEAIDCFRRALARNPALTQSAFNLGTLHQALGRHESAIPALRQVLAREPSHTTAWDALWRSQLALGRSTDAAQTFLQWERAAPPSPELVLAGLNSSRALADAARESKYLSLALEWPFPGTTPAQLSPVLALLQYFDVSQEELLRAYRRYDATITARASVPLRISEVRPDHRIRIGYVSGDFRAHVMGRLMWDVLSRHDRTAFSLHLFSLAPAAQHDAATARFQSWADGFVDLSHVDDAGAARRIANEGLDVLIDLGGHTMSARPEIYAHRPARRIITHLGYHGALGMSCVDGKVSDAIADPVGNEAYQIDPPLRIDACVFPLVAAPVAEADPVDPPPELDGKFVFAAFANVVKLSPRCVAAWKRVLDDAPNSILLFSPFSASDREGLQAVCRVAGIDAKQFAFLDLASTDPRLFRRYELAHAAMDTFPYGGGDTTLAALSMGVPVVTLAGKRHAERIGASILTHLELAELVAQDEDAFVELALRMAKDAPWRKTLVERVRNAMGQSDAHVTAHTRALETLYARLAGPFTARHPTSPLTTPPD